VTATPSDELLYYAGEVVKTRPTAVHAGINGDQAHFTSNTYHIGISELPSPGGYTNRDWFDQMPAAGSSWHACAVDTSKSTADMVADWANFERLFYDPTDPRRKYMAEYIGWNGVGSAERLDFIKNVRAAADDTHKWHDHDARQRMYYTSRECTNAQLSVRRGETKEQYLASIGQGSTRRGNMATMYYCIDDKEWALGGDSPGTSANWLVTKESGVANQLASVHGNAIQLYRGSYTDFRNRYLEPLKVQQTEVPGV
jgi:hypothetical protein